MSFKEIFIFKNKNEFIFRHTGLLKMNSIKKASSTF